MQVKELEDRPGVWSIFHEGKAIALNGKTEFTDPSPIHEFLDSRGFFVDSQGFVVSKTTPPPGYQEEQPEEETQPKQEPEEAAKVEEPQEESPAGDEPVTETAPPEVPEVPEVVVVEAPKRKVTTPRASLSEDARKAQDARVKAWREKNPEKVRSYRAKYNARRRERYHNDPEYRARVQASTRAYQAKRRASGTEADDSPQ